MKICVRAFIATALLSLCLASASRAGEIYRGNFAQNEADKISVEIVSESPLKIVYCYLNDCSEFEPTGTVEMMTLVMQPRGDFKGAEMTLRKKFGKYSAEYVHKDGRRFFARLEKE